MFSDRVEDGDEAAWTQYNPRTREHDIVRPTRFHILDPNKEPSKDSKGVYGYPSQHMEQSQKAQRNDAFPGRWRKSSVGIRYLGLGLHQARGCWGTLGKYGVLSALSEKVAKYLLEFHAGEYMKLGLPSIPDGSSSGQRHKMLQTDQVLMH